MLQEIYFAILLLSLLLCNSKVQ